MKQRNDKGFTLIEMLVVVGIIAIIVAVSIPMVNSQLEKARETADMANERAAKAAAAVLFLQKDLVSDAGGGAEDNYYFYLADSGQLVTIAELYKEGFGGVEYPDYGKCEKHKGGCISVLLDPTDKDIKIIWSGGNVDKNKTENTKTHLYPDSSY